MGAIISEPIHFPSSKQGLACGYNLRIVEGKIAGRLFEHDFTHVGRVDGNPAKSGEEPTLRSSRLFAGSKSTGEIVFDGSANLIQQGPEDSEIVESPGTDPR